MHKAYKRILDLSLIFIIGLSLQFTSAQIFINEFLASNVTVTADPDFNEYSDWIEIYNDGSVPVILDGWTLADQQNGSKDWIFPLGTIIQAKGFLLIWADGRNTRLHTDFKLSADGEEIILEDVQGNIMDQVSYSLQKADVSQGRKQDGSIGLVYFTSPTPGKSNNNSISYSTFVEQVPIFSKSGGFFNSAISIKIQDLYNKGTVRYSLDGSDPTDKSSEFTQDLLINQTTVVKARMFYPNQIPGPVVTNTYFINEKFESRNIPVLSLSTHPDYFYGKDSGLYVQNFRPGWEYPIHLEFYQKDGLLGFHHDAGVQVGGLNAWILPQKLLNIFSRKKYGSGNFDFQLFPQNAKNNFGDFILRCSGNDWSNTFFRDGLMQALIKDYADLDGQDFRPVSVYINGKYLGMHNIREKQDPEYCQYYHGIEEDSLDYIENNAEIKNGDDIEYKKMVNLLNQGVATDNAFNQLNALCNTDNFSDYIISEIFSANTSWGHNISLFKKRSGQGRWRWLLHDYDRGFDLNNVNDIAMNWFTATNGSEGSNPIWGTLFLRKMLENDKFKQKFINRFADHLYITYNPITINHKVNYHYNLIKSEMPMQINRWVGTTSSYGDAIPSLAYWQSEVEQLRQYGVQRNSFMWNDLNSFFNLAGTSSLSLDVSDKLHGEILFRGIEIPSFPWTGNYFRNRDILVTAMPNPGFKFVRWERITFRNELLLPAKSKWKYRDATSAPASNWNTQNYDDSSWLEGNGELGYGDGDEATILSYGNNANQKTPSYYFRTNINVANINNLDALLIRAKIDDGAVFYINGTEINRWNMPAAPIQIAFDSLAITAISGNAENNWNEFVIQTNLLKPGRNTIAVEVHQAVLNSADISFDAEISGRYRTAGNTISTQADYQFRLDTNSLNLQAIFESDGNCGILPDTIYNHLTLTKNCSPYLVKKSVVVLQGTRLEAEPGVEILFADKANIYVHGSLRFVGSVKDSILLTAVDGTTIWGGIFFDHATDSSVLRYVRLESASAGVDRTYFPAALSAYYSDLILDHIDITKVADNPIFSRFSNVVLTNSKIKTLVTGDGINVKQGYGYVENCEFSGGYQVDMDAIDFDGVKGGVVRNNIIHDFRGDNNDGLDIGEECENLLIEKNFIYNCYDKGISVGQKSTTGIQDNTIVNTSIGIALKDQCEAKIDHCTLYGNIEGISAYEKNYGYLGGNGIVSNCIVSNASTDAYVSDPYSSNMINLCLSDLDSMGLSQGDIVEDPFFVNPTEFNFNLKPNSAAVGKASDGKNLGAITIPQYTGEIPLLITEVHYDDSLSKYPEFIEIYNPGKDLVNLSNYTLSEAIDFTFPIGTSIRSKEAIVVSIDKSQFSGASYQTFQWEDGRLRNEGELIYLKDADGLLVDFVRYNNKIPWPRINTLEGRSIELRSDKVDNHFGKNWILSELYGGSPGVIDVLTEQKNRELENGFVVYPNPAKDVITILYNDISLHSRIECVNEYGVVVYSKDVNSNSGMMEIDLSKNNIVPGIYELRIVSGVWNLGSHSNVRMSKRVLVIGE